MSTALTRTRVVNPETGLVHRLDLADPEPVGLDPKSGFFQFDTVGRTLCGARVGGWILAERFDDWRAERLYATRLVDLVGAGRDCARCATRPAFKAGMIIVPVTSAARKRVGDESFYLVGYDAQDDAWIIGKVAGRADRDLADSLHQDFELHDADLHQHFAIVRRIARA
jgi:hypothetical protein